LEAAKAGSGEISLDATANNKIMFTAGGDCAFIGFVATVESSSNTRTITAAKEYTTHSDTVTLDFSGIDAKPYYVSAVDTTAGTVTLSKFDNDIVPLHEGYILWNTTSETSFEVPVYDADVSFSGTNYLWGSYSTVIPISETMLEHYDIYILKDGVFVPSTTGTFPVNHALLAIGKSSNAKFSIVFDDGTNGINEVKTAANNGKIYNLQGIEVKDASNGIFIKNGKKFMK